MMTASRVSVSQAQRLIGPQLIAGLAWLADLFGAFYFSMRAGLAEHSELTEQGWLSESPFATWEFAVLVVASTSALVLTTLWRRPLPRAEALPRVKASWAVAGASALMSAAIWLVGLTAL